jgi:hypothetical protein
MGFETTVSAGERPQTYALDLAATGTGGMVLSSTKYNGTFTPSTFQTYTQKDKVKAKQNVPRIYFFYQATLRYLHLPEACATTISPDRQLR